MSRTSSHGQQQKDIMEGSSHGEHSKPSAELPNLELRFSQPPGWRFWEVSKLRLHNWASSCTSFWFFLTLFQEMPWWEHIPQCSPDPNSLLNTDLSWPVPWDTAGQAWTASCHVPLQDIFLRRQERIRKQGEIKPDFPPSRTAATLTFRPSPFAFPARECANEFQPWDCQESAELTFWKLMI